MNKYIVKQYLINPDTKEVYDSNIFEEWEYSSINEAETEWMEEYCQAHPDRTVELGERLYIDWPTRRDDVRLVTAIERIKSRTAEHTDIIELLTYGRNYNYIKNLVEKRENYLKN